MMNRLRQKQSNFSAQQAQAKTEISNQSKIEDLVRKYLREKVGIGKVTKELLDQKIQELKKKYQNLKIASDAIINELNKSAETLQKENQELTTTITKLWTKYFPNVTPLTDEQINEKIQRLRGKYLGNYDDMIQS